MFEDVAITDLLGRVLSYDFDDLPTLEAGFHRVEAIQALDTSIRAAQAAQLTQISALHADRTAMMGIGRGDPSLSVIGEISMARNIGLTAAGTQVGLAVAMGRLPKLFDLLATGVISEATARAVTNEMEGLGLEHLPAADEAIANKIPGMSTARARAAAPRIVISIDPDAARVRAERARRDAYISLHPGRDGTATMIVNGPAEQLGAAQKVLDDWATGLRSTGDKRTRGQIMVQTLIERVTGKTYAEDVDVEVNLVIKAETLFGDDQTPAHMGGHGPISPDVAKDLIDRAPNLFFRRLLIDPIDGSLLVRDPRRRRFDQRTDGFIRTRDQTCRQPSCDLKIRDIDHVMDYQHGGESTVTNGQGLCKRSHTIKHLPG